MSREKPLWKLNATNPTAYRAEMDRRRAAKTITPTTTETAAMAKTIETHIDPAKLPAFIKDSFGNLYAIEGKLADLKAQYIEPVADQRTEAWRILKAKTDVTRKDLDLFYRLYKRERDAEAMEDEEAGTKILEDIRKVYRAIAKGETVNFLDVLPEAEDDDESDQGDAADELDDDESDQGDADEEIEPISYADPEADGPDADWGANDAETTDEDLDGAGHAFNAGKAAALAGEKCDNPHDGRSAAGKTWRKGWEAGTHERSTAWVQATEEGAAARRAGQSLSDNPYDHQAEKNRWKGWDDGWSTEGERMLAERMAGGDNVVHLPRDGITVVSSAAAQ